MVDKQSKLDIGTIGSSPCEVRLNSILIELNNVRVTRLVTSTIHKFKNSIAPLEVLKGNKHYSKYLSLVYEDSKRSLDMKRENLPFSNNVYTHTRCCLASYYKNALKEHMEYKKKEPEPMECYDVTLGSILGDDLYNEPFCDEANQRHIEYMDNRKPGVLEWFFSKIYS